MFLNDICTHSIMVQVQQGTNLDVVASKVGQLLVELDLLMVLLDLILEAPQLVLHRPPTNNPNQTTLLS
jgi:hypothetical protein